MKKIRFIAIALIAMMLLSLAPASMAESPKIVKVATSESIVKCDPHDQQGWPGRAAMRMVMETLVETDHEGNTTPLMAKSWEISEDNKEITFYLFDGITASNGEVVNADDVWLRLSASWRMEPLLSAVRIGISWLALRR